MEFPECVAHPVGTVEGSEFEKHSLDRRVGEPERVEILKAWLEVSDDALG
jgi:hypothetical protein